MNILILGANGFIGSAVTARLLRDGHTVTGLARSPERAAIRQAAVRWIKADLAAMITPGAWKDILSGQDAVINCAGALQDGLSDNLAATQEKAMLALYAAAKASRQQMIVQISARTEGAGGNRPFLTTKRAADEALAASGLPHAILRPALVLGRNAHGGTALLRALAALPVIMLLIHSDNMIETVSVEDVALAVALAVEGKLGPNADIDLAGTESQSLSQLVQLHRRWLGLPPAKIIPLSATAARPVTWLADMAGRLGWRSPLRSTAMAVMSEGVLRSNTLQTSGIMQLASAAETLAANPSGIQDLWTARLFLLKPVMIVILSLFWLLSGLIPLADTRAASSHFLPYMPQQAATAVLLMTCLIDIVLSATIIFRPLAKKALLGMIAVSISYLAAATVLEPALWLDPLGPLVKVLPSILLTLATLAILEER